MIRGVGLLFLGEFMKLLFGLLLVATTLTATAQSRDRETGRIELRDGNTTVRISVNERRDLNLRVRMLEEAVRDLQAQVYDLRDQPRSRVVKSVVCALKTNFDGTFIGKASTRLEAEAIARSKCRDADASFCSTTEVQCEKQDEVIY